MWKTCIQLKVMLMNGASVEISEQCSKNAGNWFLNKYINFKYITYYIHNIDRINYLLYIIFNVKHMKLTYIMIQIYH